jgi:hypothetical protein
MILVDMNQCMISNLMMQIKVGDKLDEKLVRHMVLNSLRSYNRKFREEYGDMVLCYDSKHYWRKDYFPFYKQNRKKDREKSNHDWNAIFEVLNKIRDEIRNNFPYIVMEVSGAEADDIISALCKYSSDISDEKILILSGDKDFIQLKKFPVVSQYNPLQKNFVKDINPIEYIAEHIIKGDRSDGIPNFLSSDDTFVTNKRQRPISKKNLEKWIYSSPTVFCNTQEKLDNYYRNKILIDLDCIPEELRREIVDKFKVLNSNDKTKLSIDYFVTNDLTSLMNNLEDF